MYMTWSSWLLTPFLISAALVGIGTLDRNQKSPKAHAPKTWTKKAFLVRPVPGMNPTCLSPRVPKNPISINTYGRGTVKKFL
jgi:hypothetical protein